MAELGLKPKSTDSLSFVTFSVPDSKGIRKPVHHPDPPTEGKKEKKRREGDQKKPIELLNQDWYRNCSS